MEEQFNCNLKVMQGKGILIRVFEGGLWNGNFKLRCVCYEISTCYVVTHNCSNLFGLLCSLYLNPLALEQSMKGL